ncbi:Phospholipase/carboxylesterase/thioesterase domain-containing protein [Strongyloides ratti]|uniref:palmitoyl-protein hydrolase n=1 Tax=Strongyloides ratti TaxID=34506 RepID=A0A090L6J5_STRRB|nr:Phospholipase/carboxylesterase/thioesterase domain-containing protein [Strongyloides ratti]CEF65367.1 Phospholipase/carboxylesterase/thioesterase domain-containing protein [Strongyloides ratti]
MKAVTSIPPLIIPALTHHTATVIFLHGRGDTAYGWIDSLKNEVRLPHVKYILPTAIRRPYSFYGGELMTAWYDVHNNSGKRMEDDVSVEEGRQYIYQLIEEERKIGIPYNRIVLGGFSMGGCLSLYTTLSAPFKLAGAITMSCYLLQKHLFPKICTHNNETPIWLGTGDHDKIIDISLVKESIDIINKCNNELIFQIYKGLDHSVTRQELDDCKDFLERIIP